MNERHGDKAAKDIAFIEKLLKAAGVLYALALFFYVVNGGENSSSTTAAAAFLGLLLCGIVLLAIWRFQHKEAALSRLRERWVKCLVYVGALSVLGIGPILLSVFFPVER